MKSSIAVVATLLLLGMSAGSVQAQSPSIEMFVVKLQGSITTDTGSTKITDANFVASGHRLVAILNNAQVTIDLVEMAAAPDTTILQTLLQSDHIALLSGKKGGHGQLALTLEAPGGAPTVTIHSLPVFGGELLLTGMGTGKKSGGGSSSLNGALSGIWNDPVNGNTNAPSALFKGTLQAKSL